MGKKVTVSLEVTYDFEGELLSEYLEQLNDHRDTKTQRAWFAVDRMIGHDNFIEFRIQGILDNKAIMKTKETK